MTINRNNPKLGLLMFSGAWLGLLGCGGGAVQPTGQVKTKDGANLTVSGQGRIELLFHAVEGDQSAFPANVNADGSFQVVGPQGKGIPPGKYLVSIRQLDPYHPVTAKDKLGNRYTNPKDRIPVEVGSGALVIEVQTK